VAFSPDKKMPQRTADYKSIRTHFAREGKIPASGREHASFVIDAPRILASVRGFRN
jgi:hypothetical protein